MLRKCFLTTCNLQISFASDFYSILMLIADKFQFCCSYNWTKVALIFSTKQRKTCYQKNFPCICSRMLSDLVQEVCNCCASLSGPRGLQLLCFSFGTFVDVLNDDYAKAHFLSVLNSNTEARYHSFFHVVSFCHAFKLTSFPLCFSILSQLSNGCNFVSIKTFDNKISQIL